MSVFTAVLLAAIVILLLYVIALYNGLVRLKHDVSRAWANIDVLLKQRHDELPKLVEVCRQYKQFEQDTLARVTEARAGVAKAMEEHDVPAIGAAENTLRAGLGKIFAVAESYPELRANEHFMQLQTRISGLENAIADRREVYNDSVNLFNVRIEQFPDVFVAHIFGYDAQPLLKFGQNETTDHDVGRLFNS